MNVWIMETGAYSDRYISGIFATKEAAEIACELANRGLSEGSMSGSDISEHEVYETADRHEVWWCSQSPRLVIGQFSDTRIVTYEEKVWSWLEYGSVKPDSLRVRPWSGEGSPPFVECSGVDRDRVVKAARDALAQARADWNGIT